MSLYKHLVVVSPIEEHLERLTLEHSEKQAILDMVEEIFHHKLLIVVLDHLPENDKVEFVNLVDSDNHVVVFDFLKDRIPNIEDKINNLLFDVHQEVVLDIKDLEKNEST